MLKGTHKSLGSLCVFLGSPKALEACILRNSKPFICVYFLYIPIAYIYIYMRVYVHIYIYGSEYYLYGRLLLGGDSTQNAMNLLDRNVPLSAAPLRHACLAGHDRTHADLPSGGLRSCFPAPSYKYQTPRNR